MEQSPKSRLRAGALLALSLLSLKESALAYQVSCQGSPVSATITSVMGEARPTTVGVPNRFHGGVDVPQCISNNTVQSIEAGTVVPTSACTDGNCMRVQTNSGHAFDYVHVVPLVSSGPVNVGDTIGRIISGGNHLHLNEIQSMGIAGTPFRINPQRPGALVFSNPLGPQLVPTTIGAVSNQSIILVQEFSGGTATPFVFRDSTFFVKGPVDIFINARDGSSRKGLYQIGAVPQTASYLSSPINIAFNTLFDNGGSDDDVQTIYYYRNSDSDNYIGTDLKINNTPSIQTQASVWNTDAEVPGLTQVCGVLQDYPQGHTLKQCVNVDIDRTAPTITLSAGGSNFTVATATSVVTVSASDSGGIYSIQLTGVSYSSTNYVSGVQTTASNQFPDSGNLADGAYTANVTDLAGNSAVANFSVSATSPSGSNQNDQNNSITVLPSSRCAVVQASDPGGIESITLQGIGTPKTINFSCTVPPTSTDVYVGSFCGLTGGSTYTATAVSCSGISADAPPVLVTTATAGIGICMTTPQGTYCGGTGGVTLSDLTDNDMRVDLCAVFGGTDCGLCVVGGWDEIVTTPAGSPYCGAGASCCRAITYKAPVSAQTFAVTNSTTFWSNFSGQVAVSLGHSGSWNQKSIVSMSTTEFKMTPGQSGEGMVDVAQLGQGTSTTSANGTAQANSPFPRMHFSLFDLIGYILQTVYQNLLRPSLSQAQTYLGSSAGFNSPVPLTFSYVDTVNTDTTTVKIYEFNGVSWSSASITSQSVAFDTTTLRLTISGQILHSGTFATLYAGHDSSAPVTTFSIQGSSFTFDRALFVSTDAFVVLTATDPLVNGFASTVATITYRFDPSLGGAFSIYTDSIPVPLGTHALEYRSYDYAGNAEAVKTATFTATAGTAFQASSDVLASGKLLAGFLGYGVQADVQSRAEDSWTLIVSSPDASILLNVTNVGVVGVGSKDAARLDISSESASTAVGALGLRSGNSTSTASSEIALGLGATGEMAHLLKTQHSTATFGNSMDFWLWDPVAGSTTAPARLEAVSMQAITSASGGSVHILPVGEADAELEVSNGVSEGGGTIRRAAAVTPSSREFKSDIDYLNDREIERAAQDVLVLKHASFRYKRRTAAGLVADPSQPLREGLIYEDVPESIKMKGEAVSLDDRVANLEMALKSRLKRLAELEKRLRKLQEGR